MWWVVDFVKADDDFQLLGKWSSYISTKCIVSSLLQPEITVVLNGFSPQKVFI